MVYENNAARITKKKDPYPAWEILQLNEEEVAEFLVKAGEGIGAGSLVDGLT